MSEQFERIFRDRRDAGLALADKLAAYANRADVLVLALPRGGVPVAAEVARAIHAPLDIFLVRKLGVPGHEELAMGAIATGGVRVLNQDVIRLAGITPEVIEAVTRNELEELARRERVYRGTRGTRSVRDRLIILIDDGLATGSTMRAAITALRQHKPAGIVVAVPVSAADTCDDLKAEVDRIVCAVTPEPFFGVGMWYEDFTQTTDQEVRDLLDQVARQQHETMDGRGAQS
ncbi:MAG TPA: phosphoribosyltransferase [Nitrospiraceae bacterium]|nr:phosphoribosyltransferase [Nitrospiraceae bacterium]